MRRLAAALPALALLAAPLTAQTPAPRPVDWSALSNEAVQTLSSYLQVNTTNPPGNEIKTINFLKAILQAEGFEVQVLDTGATALGPSRGNI